MRFFLLSLLVFASCVTAPAVGYGVKVDPDTKPSCAALCQEMGLRLGAIVLVRNSSGCVCVVPESSTDAAPRAAVKSGSVAVASGVIILNDEQEQAAQQQQHLQLQQQ
ncbi:MAG TPA: hypothetical protein VMT17_14225 [Anaeromyxobacteraceae bacterium]|nr:hypothetical protein [Anaeromyxobacteraceae bacterium]